MYANIITEVTVSGMRFVPTLWFRSTLALWCRMITNLSKTSRAFIEMSHSNLFLHCIRPHRKFTKTMNAHHEILLRIPRNRTWVYMSISIHMKSRRMINFTSTALNQSPFLRFNKCRLLLIIAGREKTYKKFKWVNWVWEKIPYCINSEYNK